MAGDFMVRARQHLVGLRGYVPGLQPQGDGWVKLNTNELPYGPPESVIAAIQGQVARLAAYPEPRSMALRSALAARYGLAVENVVVGNGSDDLLNLLIRCFGSEGQTVAQCDPSYSLYPVLTAIANGRTEKVAFDPAAPRIPIAEIAALDPALVFITNPNAPTGVAFALDEVAALAQRLTGLVVVDEAYGEFADDSAIRLLAQHENLCVTRTFSKAYGLAGLRVGYALGSARLMQLLDAVRDSYNVNRLSQAGALAALEAADWYAGVVRRIRATRAQFRQALLELGWAVYPSQTNFVYGAPPGGAGAAEALYQHLYAEKVLVRWFGGEPLTARNLRISIGTEAQMTQCLEAIKRWNSKQDE